MIYKDGLIAILEWILLLPAAYLMGSSLDSFLKSFESVLRGIFFFAFGLGYFVLCTVLLGSFGWLRPIPVAILILIPSVFIFKKIRRLVEWFQSLIKLLFSVKAADFLYYVCLLSVFATITLTFFVSFLPEINHDAVCYQLNVPKLFVRNASTTPLYYEFNSYIPLFMNHLYAIGLLFQSVATAKLFHWYTGVFLFFSLYYVIFDELKHRTLAMVLASLLWLTPTIINEVTTTYVDVAGAFFVFLSFVMIKKWIVQQEQMTLLLLSGILIGFGISTKLLFMIAAASAFAVIVLESISHRSVGKTFKPALFFLLGCFIGCGYWFIRNWMIYGNPLYPFLGKIFLTEPVGFGDTYQTFGVPRTIWTYLFLPWNLTIDPKSYGFGHWPGPFYLLSLPFAFVGAIKQKMARVTLIFSFIYLTLWYFMAQNYRYLTPLLPVYLFGVAHGVSFTLQKIDSIVLTRLSKIALASLVVGLASLAVYHYRYEVLTLTGKWDKETYLQNFERTYDASKWINHNLPPEAKIFNAGEVRQFYFDREVIREPWFHLRHRYLEGKTSEEALDLLRGHGFSHVLMAMNPKWQPNESLHVQRWIFLKEAMEKDQTVKKLVTIHSRNIRDDQFIYLIYQLK